MEEEGGANPGGLARLVREHAQLRRIIGTLVNISHEDDIEYREKLILWVKASLPLFAWHENDEETLLHPILVARAEHRTDVEEEVRTILRWHNRLDSRVDELVPILDEILRTDVVSDDAKDSMERFRRQVELHLEHEETHFYPLCRTLLSLEDLDVLERRMNTLGSGRPSFPAHPDDSPRVRITTGVKNLLK